VILPDPAIQDGNCLIEWADGGVSRDMQAIDARIQQAIQNFLGVSPGTVKATEK
jgi:flagellar assembly protein FliH